MCQQIKSQAWSRRSGSSLRARQDLLETWKTDLEPIEERREIRLYLRREGHFQPIFTGQPDLVFKQGSRALIVDRKLGRWQVADPTENRQLKAYAVLLSAAETALQEITVTIHSPYFQYQPYTYTRAELDRLYQSVLIVIRGPGAFGHLEGNWP